MLYGMLPLTWRFSIPDGDNLGDVPVGTGEDDTPRCSDAGAGIAGREVENDRGERLAVLPGTTDTPNFSTTGDKTNVNTLCFSPDGKFLVASFDVRGPLS